MRSLILYPRSTIVNKFKLIALVAAAFVAGHDIAVAYANRRAANLQANLDLNEKADVALRWYHVGGEMALSDKNAVAEAYAKHFPTAPPAHGELIRRGVHTHGFPFFCSRRKQWL